MPDSITPGSQSRHWQLLGLHGFAQGFSVLLFPTAVSCWVLCPHCGQLGTGAWMLVGQGGSKPPGLWQGLLALPPPPQHPAEHLPLPGLSLPGPPLCSLPPFLPPFQPSPSSNVFPCQPFPARSSGSPNCLTFPPALINAPCAVPVTSPSVLHLSEIAAFYGGSLFHQEFEQKYFQSTPSDLFRFPTHHISL